VKDKKTVRGRVSGLDLDYNGFVTAIINVGEFQALSELPINGTLSVSGLQVNDHDWQLGQMVTITIEKA
jgi:hypothetical protein